MGNKDNMDTMGGYQEYFKLIRDGIPEVIKRNHDGIAVTRTLNDSEYREELFRKLHEEIDEYYNSSSRDEKVLELSDMKEVIMALLDTDGISEMEVEQARLAKRKENGGFNYKTYLIGKYCSSPKVVKSVDSGDKGLAGN